MPKTALLDATDEALIMGLVNAGRYASAEEVVKEGLRLVARREQHLSELNAKLADGLEDIRAGRVVDGEELFEELITKYEAMARQAAE